LLADDERLARKRLRELLLAHPEIRVIGEVGSVAATVEFARRECPDLIFLDIQMPPGNGFDVLTQLDPLPKIVFVTAHDHYAVKAFEANASDYLLKPVHPDRLAETVRRLQTGPVTRSTGGAKTVEKLRLQDLVTLRDKGVLRMVPVGRIAAIQAEAAYSRILLSGLEAMLVLRPIREWENQLPFPPFARLGRSVLINLKLVRSVDVLNRDESRLGLEGVAEPLLLGRSASVRLRKLLHS
jgi:two-component system LytT family response regulator